MSEHIYEDSDMEHERYHVIPFGSMHEEIVRCRGCKHYDRMNDDEGICMVPDDNGDYARWMVDAVGYCYLGEKRGE